MRFENANLWISEGDMANRNDENCISLINRFNESSKRKEIDGKYVEITGVFSADAGKTKDGTPIVRMAACSDLALKFDPEKIKYLNENMKTK